MVKPALKETPQRHAVRGRGFSPGGCSGGCYLALGDRAVRTAEPANLEVRCWKLEIGLRWEWLRGRFLQVF